MFMNEGRPRLPGKTAAPFSFAFVAAGITLLLSLSFAQELGSQSQALPPFSHRKTPSPRPLLLVIIDFDGFSCLTCLDSFLDFYHQLSNTRDERLLWGVLVFDAAREKQRDRSFIQIIEKKLNGFIKGNDLRFPIVIDRYHLFESLGEEGSAVLVLDPNDRVMTKYVFPLRPNQVQEILSLLKD